MSKDQETRKIGGESKILFGILKTVTKTSQTTSTLLLKLEDKGITGAEDKWVLLS